jgi:uncharacterized RDD family membrane protein YckC
MSDTTLAAHERSDAAEAPAELAGMGRRSAALLIDAVLVLAWAALGVLTHALTLPATPVAAGIAISAYSLTWLLATDAILVGMIGATPGKLAVGIRVTRGDGRPVSFGRAIGRWFGRVPSAVLLIGYVIAFFDSRRRTLHDRIADTIVVRRGARATDATIGAAGPEALRAAAFWMESLPWLVVVAIVTAGVGSALHAFGFGESTALATRILRLATLGALQGVTAGFALGHARLAWLGAVFGGVAGGLIHLLMVAMEVGFGGGPLRPFIYQAPMILDVAIAASAGVALRSKQAARWAVASVCIAFLRFPLVGWIVAVIVSLIGPGFESMLAFNGLHNMLLWAAIAGGLRIGYARFPDRMGVAPEAAHHP